VVLYELTTERSTLLTGPVPHSLGRSTLIVTQTFFSPLLSPIDRHSLIAVEDLAVKTMVRSARGTIAAPGVNVAAKRGLNRAISAQGWSRLRHRPLDKAATCKVTVLSVNPAHTSQRCAVCGHICAENRKNQAVFGCQACGHEANADVNAAKNILAAGLAVTARGGTSQQHGPDEART